MYTVICLLLSKIIYINAKKIVHCIHVKMAQKTLKEAVALKRSQLIYSYKKRAEINLHKHL